MAVFLAVDNTISIILISFLYLGSVHVSMGFLKSKEAHLPN